MSIKNVVEEKRVRCVVCEACGKSEPVTNGGFHRSHWIGRVQNSNGSWRPDVPIWVLRIGGLFFRLAWRTLITKVLFKAIALKSADKKMTWLQRWHMFVLENYAYWDQYDEMSDEDRKGIVK